MYHSLLHRGCLIYSISDGIKDREKGLVMTTLRQISTFKDNEYILLRGIWNDVQEDWPYYTEQEKQIMKRCVCLSE
jgi:RNA polymerase II elongation factor ELL